MKRNIETNEENNQKRLSVEIPFEMHNKLKFLAVVRNCSIRKLVMRALIAYIKHESKFN